MGRTGRLFAHQWFDGAEPDIMAIAKALGCGFPVGACIASAEAAFDEIAKPATLANAEAIGRRLAEGLGRIAADHPSVIVDVRGKGMLIGVKLVVNNREFMAAARREKLLVAGGGDNCVRLLPSLLMTEQEAGLALDRFAATVRHFAELGVQAA